MPVFQSRFLITRLYLFEKLDAGLEGRLTLVSAPAGYGKTTLIGQWIRMRLEKDGAGHDNGLAICWVSLDDGDNDPALFWSYVLAALEQAGMSLGRQLLTSLTAPAAPPIKAVITHLLNALEAHDEQIIFVLDDYHAINEGAIHEQVAYLIEHLSPGHQVILLTRADPPLPIARWRARRQMAEVRQVDLRFDIPETSRLLNDILALELTANDVAILERRTEGWVAGLQLVAIALGQQGVDRRAFIDSFAGSHHYIMTYLVDEVLRQQPRHTRRFLQQTSVLRRLCAPLCAAVTGNRESDKLLQEMCRQNLFLIPLDDPQLTGGHLGQSAGLYWYRTHHLFADLLANRLERDHSALEIETLQRRAAEWYEANGFPDEAIYHALRCADMSWAAALVEKHARLMMRQGRLNTLLRWIEMLPADILAQRPRLCLDQAWSLFLSGKISASKEILLETRRSLQQNPHLAVDNSIRGELATMLANCALMEEDIVQVMAEVDEALAYLPADDADLQSVVFRARALNAVGAAYGLAGDTKQFVRVSQEVHRLALSGDNLFLAAHALSMIAEARFHQGRLRESASASKQIITLVKDHPWSLNQAWSMNQTWSPEQAWSAELNAIASPIAGMGYIALAAVQVERCELEAAARGLEQGLAISGQGGIGYKHLDAYCTMARLRAAAGDVAGSGAALERAAAFALLPLQKLQLAAYTVRFWLGQGDLAMAQRVLRSQTAAVPPRLPVVMAEVMDVLQAWIFLVEGEWTRVLALRESVVQSAGQPNALRLARVAEVQVLSALALEELGEREQALASLETAVNLAAAEEARLTFLEPGPKVAILLRALRDSGRSPQPFTDQLLGLFPDTAVSQFGLVEPLSERELEVLRLIAAGKSNREIAAALVVTLNTVKKHSSHIYGKLGVNGRTQAVARARELGLL